MTEPDRFTFGEGEFLTLRIGEEMHLVRRWLGG